MAVVVMIIIIGGLHGRQGARTADQKPRNIHRRAAEREPLTDLQETQTGDELLNANLECPRSVQTSHRRQR